MSNTGKSTLNNGNPICSGKPPGSRTKSLLELHRFGEERVMTHYAMLDKLASEGDIECAKFIVERVLPKAKGSRHIQMDLGPIQTLDDISKAQENIVTNITDGSITIEEGQKISEIVKDRQKTIEMIEFAQQVQDINERMKKAGI